MRDRSRPLTTLLPHTLHLSQPVISAQDAEGQQAVAVGMQRLRGELDRRGDSTKEFLTIASMVVNVRGQGLTPYITVVTGGPTFASGTEIQLPRALSDHLAAWGDDAYIGVQQFAIRPPRPNEHVPCGTLMVLVEGYDGSVLRPMGQASFPLLERSVIELQEAESLVNRWHAVGERILSREPDDLAVASMVMGLGLMYLTAKDGRHEVLFTGLVVLGLMHSFVMGLGPQRLTVPYPQRVAQLFVGGLVIGQAVSWGLEIEAGLNVFPNVSAVQLSVLGFVTVSALVMKGVAVVHQRQAARAMACSAFA